MVYKKDPTPQDPDDLDFLPGAPGAIVRYFCVCVCVCTFVCSFLPGALGAFVRYLCVCLCVCVCVCVCVLLHVAFAGHFYVCQMSVLYVRVCL